MSSADPAQTKILNTAFEAVKLNAFYMKRSMDSGDVDETIKFATEMLSELRSNTLFPKYYYQLYLHIANEMRELEEFFSSLQRDGEMRMTDLYEKVQGCGQVVPRLYLMCCVGGVYIASQEIPAKDVLKDMVDMVKGVQHPMRGLFVRYYLTQITKDKLPDIGSPYEGAGGSVQDACSFILQNFIETNRLWIRLMTHGGKQDKKKKELERQDLSILVGTSLVRLSQLEGLDIIEYKENLLPSLLDEIVNCKDTLAQTYLMDVIINVFPDEFHIATLSIFLNAIIKLKEKVNIKNILESLVSRLSEYISNSGSEVISPEINAFKLFNDCVKTLIEGRTNMTLVATLNLQTVLTDFALKCYNGKNEYVSHCLKICCTLIEKDGFVAPIPGQISSEISDTALEVTETIERLLSNVLSVLALRVMKLPHVAKLMSYLPFSSWKDVAAKLLNAVITSNNMIAEVEGVEQLFSVITPLLRDEENVSMVGGKRDGDEDDDDEGRDTRRVSIEFKKEQYLVARMIHLMKNDDTDIQLQMYTAAKEHFTYGGKLRMQFTFTPLVFCALELARKVYARESLVASSAGGEEGGESTIVPPRFSSKKVFQFVIEIVTAMATSYPETALKLFLNSAQAADEFNFPAIAYEFMKESLLVYESEITDSKAQVRVLHSIIGTLLTCRNFPSEDYEALITKTAQYAHKLLKKPDQCRMITLCSHLFWPKKIEDEPVDGGGEAPEFYNDSERVQECLERALKIASVCNPMLFVDILDHYLYYFENDNPIIQARYITGLIALINEQFGAVAQGQTDLATVAHYKNTIDYIRQKQAAPETNTKFMAIEV